MNYHDSTVNAMNVILEDSEAKKSCFLRNTIGLTLPVEELRCVKERVFDVSPVTSPVVKRLEVKTNNRPVYVETGFH